MNYADRGSIATIGRVIGLGQIPKCVVELNARATALTVGARAMVEPATALGATLVAALDRGDDPLDDPAVARSLTATGLVQLASVGVVEESVVAIHRDVYRANVDEIVKAMTVTFDKARDRLLTARDVLGDVDLGDATTILARGGADTAAAWTAARESGATIIDVVGGWTVVHDFTGILPAAKRWQSMRYCDPSVDQANEFGLDNTAVTPWDAARLGVPLSLPASASEYRTRVATIERARTAAQAADDRAAHDRGAGKLPVGT